MLHVRTQIKTTLTPSCSPDEVAFLLERMPERLRGFGQLRLMGIRNVRFDVAYDLTWVRSMGLLDGIPDTKHTGRVHLMTRHNGRPLPDGVYALESVQGFRLAHFGNRWSIHFS